MLFLVIHKTMTKEKHTMTITANTYPTLLSFLSSMRSIPYIVIQAPALQGFLSQPQAASVALLYTKSLDQKS